MFFTLFLKECKSTLKSIAYIIFIICIVLFYVTQMGDVDTVKKPKAGQENYGTKMSTDQKDIEAGTLSELIQQYDRNSYPTYPIGFYKEVILNEDKQEKVADVIEELTGMKMPAVLQKLDDYYNEMASQETEQGYVMSNTVLDVQVQESISYEKFLSKLEQIDKMLGGGSDFSRKNVERGVSCPMTYEEAVDEYDSIIDDDSVTRAYARLFSDYMGIVLAILPVFLAVARELRDKRSKASEVIWSKRSSSICIMLSRYLAQVCLVLLPLLLISILPLSQVVYQANYLGVAPDYLAFVKYIFGWLMPTVLFVLSVGFLFTELSGGVLAILLQGIFWLVSIFCAMSSIVGYVGWNLVPRFNTLGLFNVYKAVFPQLVKNRICYTLLAIVLFAITVVIYDRKRKGGWNRGRKNSSNLESTR